MISSSGGSRPAKARDSRRFDLYVLNNSPNAIMSANFHEGE